MTVTHKAEDYPRVFHKGVEYTRITHKGVDYFVKAALPSITSYTITPDHYRDTDTRGSLVLAFAVTGSVRNTITEHLASGVFRNVPLSPSTGATISPAPAQDAHYTLTATNSLGEHTIQNAYYTYWTAPTISVGAPGNAGFHGGGGVIYIPVTRGGNPLPSVSVVASDGHGSGSIHFIPDNALTHRYQISGAQTGSPRTVTYTFTATSRVGSETRTATAATSFTWPA